MVALRDTFLKIRLAVLPVIPTVQPVYLLQHVHVVNKTITLRYRVPVFLVVSCVMDVMAPVTLNVLTVIIHSTSIRQRQPASRYNVPHNNMLIHCKVV